MNGVALRTERALVDWLAAQDWSASPLGAPTCLTSYGHGAFADPDLEDQMPDFPRIVVRSSTAVPVHPIDRTCEVDVTATLQLSADDTPEYNVLATVAAFEDILQPLFVDDNISELNVGEYDPSGGFVAYFATPTDFGMNDTSERSRTFSRSMRIFAAANTVTT
jgi:hypothetical protein